MRHCLCWSPLCSGGRCAHSVEGVSCDDKAATEGTKAAATEATKAAAPVAATGAAVAAAPVVATIGGLSASGGARSGREAGSIVAAACALDAGSAGDGISVSTSSHRSAASIERSFGLPGFIPMLMETHMKGKLPPRPCPPPPPPLRRLKAFAMSLAPASPMVLHRIEPLSLGKMLFSCPV